eukprot:GHVT01078575.1.p2 GENE.GHVT01078575.1~~GHVT01078575.1.p2  ORF type:complete len:187 (+),score=31.83 GHVT01078575.1:670-1230(+)
MLKMIIKQHKDEAAPWAASPLDQPTTNPGNKTRLQREARLIEADPGSGDDEAQKRGERLGQTAAQGAAPASDHVLQGGRVEMSSRCPTQLPPLLRDLRDIYAKIHHRVFGKEKLFVSQAQKKVRLLRSARHNSRSGAGALGRNATRRGTLGCSKFQVVSFIGKQQRQPEESQVASTQPHTLLKPVQ